MPESFAERLKRLRSERHITQQQLAAMMYVDRSSVARWESGSRLPDLVLVPRLARCLGVEISSLIPGDSPMDKVPVAIIVDDEPSVLAGGLKTLCEALPGAEITGFVKPGEALEYARHKRVDLAFLDIEMGRTSGFDLCQRLLEINPATSVVYLTAFPDYSLKAWNTGAKGFLVKPLDEQDVSRQLDMLQISLPGREPEGREASEEAP